MGANSTVPRNLDDAENELHNAARRGTGLNEFGNPAYRKGLRAFLSACCTDLPQTDANWQFACATVRSTLIARLYTQKGWAEHPEALNNPIHKLLLITGLPRTGTTALHKLLSVDPQFQGVELWLMSTPMRRPPRETWETYKEYRACVARIAATNTMNPELRKAHELVAGDPGECDVILAQNFLLAHPLTRVLMPTYSNWYAAQSRRESYRRYADVLRLIGSSEPHKMWVLKSPHRMTEIEAMLEEFPDARVIQTHRDPLQTIPSHCDLLRMSLGGRVRPEQLGPMECSFWRQALDRMEIVRQKRPRQFFDVDHRQFLADPLGTVCSIYEHFGLTLSDRAEQKMREWIAASPTSRHGKHQYALEGWGITRAQIGETFARYRAQHQFD